MKWICLFGLKMVQGVEENTFLHVFVTKAAAETDILAWQEKDLILLLVFSFCWVLGRYRLGSSF